MLSYSCHYDQFFVGIKQLNW